MCLEKAKLLTNRKEPITAYKVFLAYPSHEYLYAPYQSFVFPLTPGEVIKAGWVEKGVTPGLRDIFYDVNLKGEGKVDLGCFHLFKNKEDAFICVAETVKGRESYKVGHLERFEVWECTIPVESRFVFEGVFSDLPYLVSYASESIIINKRVERFLPDEWGWECEETFEEYFNRKSYA